ncbi:MAG: phage tail tube protein, partial [Phycisphaerae bacterium]
MSSQVIGGIADFKIDGIVYPVKGNWTFNAGFKKRTTVVGADSIHGVTEVPQPAMFSGIITNRNEVDLELLLNAVGVTINLTMAGPTGDT